MAKQQWSVKRIVDTLNKYNNGHVITKISNWSDDYLEITLLYNSEKMNSKTETTVRIYCDDYTTTKEISENNGDN